MTAMLPFSAPTFKAAITAEALTFPVVADWRRQPLPASRCGVRAEEESRAEGGHRESAVANSCCWAADATPVAIEEDEEGR